MSSTKSTAVSPPMSCRAFAFIRFFLSFFWSRFTFAAARSFTALRSVSNRSSDTPSSWLLSSSWPACPSSLPEPPSLSSASAFSASRTRSRHLSSSLKSFFPSTRRSWAGPALLNFFRVPWQGQTCCVGEEPSEHGKFGAG
jgi:hypothetical protein